MEQVAPEMDNFMLPFAEILPSTFHQTNINDIY